MKKYLLFLIVLPVLTACLDEHPKGQLTEEEAYGSATSLYINTISTLYNYIGGNEESQGLQGTYRGVYDYNTFTTDEAMLPTRGGDWYDGGFWQGLYLHQWSAADLPLYATWTYLYKVVGLCNHSLALLEQYRSLLTARELPVCQAEVRSLRALYYYYLLDLFGNVPLCTTYISSTDQVTQSGRGAVFRFVVSELEAALPFLYPQESQREGYYYGKLTLPVAYFLLAKLALNAEVYSDDNWTDGQRPDGKNIFFEVDGQRLNAWETTVAYCEKLGAFGYRLETNYTTNFAIGNENSCENIFTIPMDKTLYTNWFRNLFRSRHYNHGAALGMDAENGTSATRSTVRTFGYGTPDIDARYRCNFYSDTLLVDGKNVYLDNGEALVYHPLEVRLDLTGSPYEKTAGARMSKYEIDRTAYNDGWLQSNDIVLFRYGDALLMAAEAKVRNGQDGSYELNLVRRRAGMPDREATLNTLLDERLMELMWEGWRRQDLIRFGRFTTAYDERPQLPDEASGYTTVFPIPSKVLDLNKNLHQNPGYEN